jgi:hypothetical protein
MGTVTKRSFFDLLLALSVALLLLGCGEPEAGRSVDIAFVSPNEGEQPGLIDLEPAIGPDQVKQWVAEFAWSETEPLVELTKDGEPALYYARVYATSRDELGYLDELGLQHSTLPLFAHERVHFRGKIGRVRPPSDGRGVLISVILPGKVFNVIRDYALQGVALFESIEIVRDLPEQVVNVDGSLSWDALGESGFRLRGAELEALVPSSPSSPSSPSAPGLAQATQPLVILTVREALHAAAEVSEEVLRAIARAAGNRDRNGLAFGWGAAGTAYLYITTDLRETDSAFGGTLPATNASVADESRPMRRAWGDKAGQTVKLPGVRVSVWSNGDSTVLWLPTLFEGTTDDEGKASIEVAKGRSVDELCIATENDAAEITDFLTEIEVCDFKSFSQGDIDDVDSLAFVNVRIQDSYFNVLAQVTEARAYLREIVGYSPYKADILVGPIADLMGPQAFTPCLGFPNVSADLIIGAVIAAVTIADPPSGIVLGGLTSLLAVDMILPHYSVITQPEFPFPQKSTDSRGMATHEYGHFATCSMLYDSSASKISGTWTGAMLERIAEGGLPSADADRSYDVEALADFMSAQIVGGTAYFTLGEPDVFDMSYCLGASSDCMDRNVTSSSTLDNNASGFDVNTARVATTLHDAFDGQLRWSFGWTDDSPGNGDMWQRDADGLLTYSSQHAGDAHDEPVALPGQALREFVGRLGFTQGDFMGALADTIYDHGYDWCDACEVFAVHDDKLIDDTQAERYAVCAQAPIASWLGTTPNAGLPQSCNFAGCPDGTVPNHWDNRCDVCPPGEVEVDGWDCQPCPPQAVVIDNSCQYCDDDGACTAACPGRTVPEDGACVECLWEQIAVDDQCQACPDGLLRYENECVTECPPGPGDAIIIDRGVCTYVIL